MIPHINASHKINQLIKKNKIKGSLAVDFYAHFIQLYDQDDRIIQLHLINSLHALDEPLTENFLAHLFLSKGESPDWVNPIRLGEIIKQLAYIAPNKALTIAISLIHDGDPLIQQKVIYSLGYAEISKLLPTPKLLPLLHQTLYQALESENRKVKIAAITSIGNQNIKKEKIIQKLLEKVQATHTDPAIQGVAIKALSQLGVAEIISDCIEILEDQHQEQIKIIATKAISER